MVKLRCDHRSCNRVMITSQFHLLCSSSNYLEFISMLKVKFIVGKNFARSDHSGNKAKKMTMKCNNRADVSTLETWKISENHKIIRG